MVADEVAELLGETRDGDRGVGMAGLGDGDDSDNVGGAENGWGRRRHRSFQKTFALRFEPIGL